MVEGCGARCIKFTIFSFNFLVFLAGLIIVISCGIAYARNPLKTIIIDDPDTGSHDEINYAALKGVLIAGMIIGSIVLSLGFLGCCGALMESTVLLTMFGCVVVLMVLAQIAIGVLVLESKVWLKDGFYDAINKTAMNVSQESDHFCNQLKEWEMNLTCCGTRDPNTFTHLKSVCHLDCNQDGKNAMKPCDDVIWNMFAKIGNSVGITCIVILILEVISLTFSCCLCLSIRRGENIYERFQ